MLPCGLGNVMSSSTRCFTDSYCSQSVYFYYWCAFYYTVYAGVYAVSYRVILDELYLLTTHHSEQQRLDMTSREYQLTAVTLCANISTYLMSQSQYSADILQIEGCLVNSITQSTSTSAAEL